MQVAERLFLDNNYWIGNLSFEQNQQIDTAWKADEARYIAKLMEMSGATDSHRPLLFVGSWVRTPGLKCGPPPPEMAFFRRLQKWFIVVRVYEANTSRLFYANGQELLDPLHGADVGSTTLPALPPLFVLTSFTLP